MSAATVAAFDAVALLESLRGRGADVSIKGTGAGAWLHVAPRGVLSDSERADFRRHKSELLAALDTTATTGETSAPEVAHRWQGATGETSAPSIVFNEITPDELTATGAAQAILDAAYFNLARGGVWCIGWQQAARAAWQWACIANGGTLDEKTGLPSMEAAAAIEWAKAQKETFGGNRKP